MTNYEVRLGDLLLGTLRNCRPLDDHNIICVFDAEPPFEEYRPLFDMWWRGMNTEGGEGAMIWLEATHAIDALELRIISLDTGDEATEVLLTIDGDEAMFRRSS